MESRALGQHPASGEPSPAPRVREGFNQLLLTLRCRPGADWETRFCPFPVSISGARCHTPPPGPLRLQPLRPCPAPAASRWGNNFNTRRQGRKAASRRPFAQLWSLPRGQYLLLRGSSCVLALNIKPHGVTDATGTCGGPAR